MLSLNNFYLNYCMDFENIDVLEKIWGQIRNDIYILKFDGNSEKMIGIAIANYILNNRSANEVWWFGKDFYATFFEGEENGKNTFDDNITKGDATKVYRKCIKIMKFPKKKYCIIIEIDDENLEWYKDFIVNYIRDRLFILILIVGSNTQIHEIYDPFELSSSVIVKNINNKLQFKQSK